MEMEKVKIGLDNCDFLINQKGQVFPRMEMEKVKIGLDNCDFLINQNGQVFEPNGNLLPVTIRGKKKDSVAVWIKLNGHRKLRSISYLLYETFGLRRCNRCELIDVAEKFDKSLKNPYCAECMPIIRQEANERNGKNKSASFYVSKEIDKMRRENMLKLEQAKKYVKNVGRNKR
jgi:hypothetical protein